MPHPVDNTIRVYRETRLSPLPEDEAARVDIIKTIVGEMDAAQSTSIIRFDPPTHKIVCSAVASTCCIRICRFPVFLHTNHVAHVDGRLNFQ